MNKEKILTRIFGKDIPEWDKFTSPEKKALIQERGADLWTDNDGKGVFEWATGVGKTFGALECLSNMLHGSRVLFLAETILREATISEDIEKYDAINGTNLRKDYDIEFACYQAAYKWKNMYFDLVVADEVHDSLTNEYYKFYENNNYGNILCLSATIPRETKITEDSELTKGDLIDELAPTLMKITQDDAIALGLIQPYELLVLYHSLDKKEKVFPGGTKAKPFMTTERAAYDYAEALFKKALFLPEKSKKFALMNAARKRANVLYKAPSKTKVAKKILKELKSLKTVVFGNSLEVLGELTPNVVSSNNNKATNAHIIERFNRGILKRIASFKQLKQGENLAGANLQLQISYYSTEKDFNQRLGRILRFKEGEYTAAIVFVTMETQEMVWYQKMTKDINAPTVIFDDPDKLIKYIKEKS